MDYVLCYVSLIVNGKFVGSSVELSTDEFGACLKNSPLRAR